MSEFLGARISLISKSDIRYSGVLHEINSEESTVSLENVVSYGTEGRKGKPEEEIPPADQIYEYIVFRGSDVKDLRVEEGPGSKEPPPPPNVPNDPAIVGARPRPGNTNAPPPFQQGPRQAQGQPPQGNLGFAPNMPVPPPGAWGPGGPPPRNFQYPPPPGWYPPQGPGFGAAGPAPWNNYYPPMPGPYGPGALGPNNGRVPPQQQPQQPPQQQPQQKPQQQSQQQPQQQPQQPPQAPGAAGQRPSPIGAGIDKQKVLAPAELDNSAVQPPASKAGAVPTGPRARQQAETKKPDVPSTTTQNGPADALAGLPTGPKAATRFAPIVPLPAGLVQKTVTHTTVTTTKQDPAANSSALRDATQAAKAAVAVAMAKLEGGGSTSAATAGPTTTIAPAQSAASQFPSGSAIDNLTRKVNEMRVNAEQQPGPNANGRGRGRGGAGGNRGPKVTVPDSDFDFATANAKFNKVDVVKEAVAGPPLPADSVSGEVDVPDAFDSVPSPEATGAPAVAYNKTRSFFDNISSDAKERAEKGAQKAGGREWRGEEQRRNMETFGQGSVDGGFRGYRGRGRGGRGRGGYGRGRGGGGGFRRSDQQGVAS